MEIRELAERLLLSDRIEDKLAAIGPITDQARGTGLLVPDAPGRPDALRFASRSERRSRGGFPRRDAMADPAGRGRVLHFFANHELLAIELMALVLLRFPEAPAAFRAGLVAVIGEEQRHLADYLTRMEALGVRPGDVPVSDFFWKSLAGVHDPLAFVAGMSLTFEQANLDFAALFEERMREVGDDETAALLQRVYEDEIGHVRHGLTWLRRWKAPGLDDWEAWTGALPAPLTPRRARGEPLVVDARLRAGLSMDFVERLEAAGHSRGRVPDVWRFDVAAELELAPDARPPRGAAARIRRDLEVLPIFMAREGDVVVCERPPGPELLTGARRAGFAGVEIVPSGESDRRGARARLWCPTPRAVRSVSGWRLREPPTAPPDLRVLFSKRSLIDLEARLVDEGLVDEPLLVGAVAPGSSLEDALAMIRGALSRGAVLLRPALGTSGRAQRRILPDEEPDTPAIREYIMYCIKGTDGLAVSRLISRTADLSVHLQNSHESLAASHPIHDVPTGIAGFSRMIIGPSGRYRGCVLGRRWNDLPRPIRQALHREDGFLARLERTACIVGGWLAGRGHRGPAGIDAMIEGVESPRLHPLVEVNPRTTLGTVGLALERRVAPGAVAVWVQLDRREREAAGARSWGELAASLPSLVVDGGMRAGCLTTSDPATCEELFGVLSVGASLDEALAPLAFSEVASLL